MKESSTQKREPGRAGLEVCVKRIDEIAPKGVAAGTRCPETGMAAAVNR